MSDNLSLWHQVVESRDPTLLEQVIAEDCVFLSPIVYSPQVGGELTRLYLTGAMHVLGDGFHYVKEVASGHHAMLEFVCEVDGIEVNGVDIITFNPQGKITEFKVMVRPLQAVNVLHARMKAMLEELSA